MAIQTLTIFHILSSIIAIISGYIVTLGFLNGRLPAKWNNFYLFTTFVTSASGFAFPFVKLLPSHIFGIISLLLLAVAIYALYVRGMAGAWSNSAGVPACSCGTAAALSRRDACAPVKKLIWRSARA